MTRDLEAPPLTGSTPPLVRTSRGTIECAMGGEGPAILAIHGGMGGHDQSWLLARALSGDLRGHHVSLFTHLDLVRERAMSLLAETQRGGALFAWVDGRRRHQLRCIGTRDCRRHRRSAA